MKGTSLFMQPKFGPLALLLFSACHSTVFAKEGYWEFLADFVYMERYHVDNQTIVINSSRCVENCDINLDVKDLASGFGFEPGLQVGLSYIVDDTSAYQGSFLYIWNWSNSKTRTSERSDLIVPFKNPTFVTNFFDVAEVQAYYDSQFYTAELNFSKAFSDSRHSYLAFSGIGGLRFASLSETFSLTGFERSHFAKYKIESTNDLIGIQVGFLFQINAVKHLHWDLMGKSGVGLNRMNVDSFLGDQSNTVQLRNFSKQQWQSVIFAEAYAGAGYRFLPNLDLRAGYQMLYFCGLALAPDQIDTSSRTSGLTVDRNGYVIVHGIYAGLNFSF